MPKYYLLGGENTHKRDAEKVNQKAFNDAGEAPENSGVFLGKSII